MSMVAFKDTEILVNGEWVPLGTLPANIPAGASEVRFRLVADPDTEADDACRQIMRNILAQRRAQQHEHFLAWVEEMQIGHA